MGRGSVAGGGADASAASMGETTTTRVRRRRRAFALVVRGVREVCAETRVLGRVAWGAAERGWGERPAGHPAGAPEMRRCERKPNEPKESGVYVRLSTPTEMRKGGTRERRRRGRGPGRGGGATGSRGMAKRRDGRPERSPTRRRRRVRRALQDVEIPTTSNLPRVSGGARGCEASRGGLRFFAPSGSRGRLSKLALLSRRGGLSSPLQTRSVPISPFRRPRSRPPGPPAPSTGSPPPAVGSHHPPPS